MKKFISILITVLVLLALIGGVAAYIILNRPQRIPPDAVGNTSGNLNNHGLFCESDGYVYFSNPYDSRKLYRMTLDGSDLECICDVAVSFINVYGNEVYFYQEPGGGSQMYGLGGMYGVCKTNTTGTKGLDSLDKTVLNSLVLVGEDLYYQHYDAAEGLTLYKTDRDGKEKTKISDKEVFTACPYQGAFLCYNTDNMYYLSAFNPKTDSMLLLGDIRAYNIIKEGDYIYFMNIDDDYKIYRCDSAGQNPEKLTDYRVDLFNVYGNNIFFQKNSEDAPAIMKMDTNGGNEIEIMPGNFTDINCTSTYTYFYGFGESAPLYRVPTNGASAQVFDPTEQ